MKVRYLVRVSANGGDRRVDRTAWAALVDTWKRTIAGGNQTRLAEILGVTSRTVSRWLNQEVDVSEGNVTAAARAVGRSPIELLVRVGYYDPEEVAAAAISARPEPGPESADELEFEITQIMQDNSLPRDVREDMVHYARELLDQQRAEETALRERHERERRRQLARLWDIVRRGAKPAT